MVTPVTPTVPPPEDLEARLRQLEEQLRALAASRPWFAALPSWAVNLLSTLGLVAVVGAAFWLGSIGSQVEQQSKKLDDLTAIVRGVESRVGVLEARVAAMDERLKAMDGKLDAISGKLDKR